MKDLQKLFNECKEEMRKANIPFNEDAYINVSNRKSVRTWGTCRNKVDIRINALLLDDNVDDKETKDTIIHELIHTCKDTHGHDYYFRLYGNRMNDMFGYHISRCNSKEQKGITIDYERMSKYKFVCPNCNRVSYKQKLPKYMSHRIKWNEPIYSCRLCHTAMKTIVLH